MTWINCQQNNCDQLLSSAKRLCDPRERAKTSLLEFTKFTTPDYRPNWHHKEFRRQCDTKVGLRWSISPMLSHGVPKAARIRRLSQYVLNHELRFKADSPGCRLLADQLMDFPLADHDDGPDALKMCIGLLLDYGDR